MIGVAATLPTLSTPCCAMPAASRSPTIGTTPAPSRAISDQEAFANLYKDVAEVMAARIAGRPCNPMALDFPTVEDGAKGIAMIEACLESARTGRWVRVPSAC